MKYRIGDQVQVIGNLPAFKGKTGKVTSVEPEQGLYGVTLDSERWFFEHELEREAKP
jgi:ribosomal protein L24